MSPCLACGAGLQPFMSFGRMPIANGFLAEHQFADEFFFDLKAGCCPDCSMVQLTEIVDPGRLFHAQYAYFSSISVRMAEHFRRFADEVHARFLSPDDPFVVEIGSNDGIMLRHFAARGVRHLGIEPSQNVAEAAVERRVNTLCEFFNEETARRIRQQHGSANVIYGANVICHLPNIHSVLRGIDHLLQPDGVFVFEEPYLGDIVEKASYDQIYDEHVFYFSALALGRLFEGYEMEIVDLAPQEVHGGSMRWVIARKGRRTASRTVAERLDRERALGLADPGTFDRFRRRVEESRVALRDLIGTLRARGKRIVGYGATSKSTTVINYCGLGPELIEFISDTTPTKQRKFSPGMHIPVRPYENFADPYPDYALLFAWNHAAEILAKEERFRAAGGRFVVYVPEVGLAE